MTTREEMLALRLHRSVVLERDERGNAVVVKRFHHRNALLALFDGVRARGEFTILRALERERFPAPRALEVRSLPTGWELRLAAVPGARKLEEFLGGDVPPAGWPRLVRALGALLARLHATGWRHADLHPGNVLVDERGEPWLVDWRRARRARPDAESRSRELVLAAALAREALGPRDRARFLVAYLAALPEELRSRARTSLAATLEAEAVVRRRTMVLEGLGRWLRPSSRVCAVERSGEPLLLRRDLEHAPEDDRRDPRRVLVLHGERRELEARWLAAARLHEHRLPVTPPVALARGAGASWAAFGLVGARTGAGSESTEALRLVDELLRDRGLELAEPLSAESLVAGPEGFLLRPPRALA